MNVAEQPEISYFFYLMIINFLWIIYVEHDK